MELIRSNNYKTATLAYESALEICNSTDPQIFNELGLVSYRQGDYFAAENYLNKGLELCKESNSKIYQDLLFNLGHVYRKLR